MKLLPPEYWRPFETRQVAYFLRDKDYKDCTEVENV